MKTSALIVVGAFVGASLTTIVLLPLCLWAMPGGYCMPPVDWLAPLFISLGSEGGASGIFGAIWLEYFVALLILFVGALWVRRKYSN